MSMLSHSDEFLDLYKYAKSMVFESSKPDRCDDILGFTYTNKPDELEKGSSNEQ